MVTVRQTTDCIYVAITILSGTVRLAFRSCECKEERWVATHRRHIHIVYFYEDGKGCGARARDSATLLLFTLMAALIITFTGSLYDLGRRQLRRLSRYTCCCRFSERRVVPFSLILLFGTHTRNHNILYNSNMARSWQASTETNEGRPF